MATVTKKPTSKFWFAAFRDAGGRQRRISTGTTDKERAKQIAKQYKGITGSRLHKTQNGVVVGFPRWAVGRGLSWRGLEDRCPPENVIADHMPIIFRSILGRTNTLQHHFVFCTDATPLPPPTVKANVPVALGASCTRQPCHSCHHKLLALSRAQYLCIYPTY